MGIHCVRLSSTDIMWDSQILDPFQVNFGDDNNKIVDYHGEQYPEKNKLSHHQSKSSNSYIKGRFNKYVSRNTVNNENVNIRSSPANLNNFVIVH